MKVKKKHHMHVQEILLCESVLTGSNDCIVAVPLGCCEPLGDGERLYFEALYLDGAPPPLTTSDMAFKVLRYSVENNGEQYALVALRMKRKLEENNSLAVALAGAAAVFAFSYWTER
jgi:hypothetical protein